MRSAMREAFARMIQEMPLTERLAMLAALEQAEVVDGMVDLMAVAQDALARLGVPPAEADAAIGAAFANPPDWRRSLS